MKKLAIALSAVLTAALAFSSADAAKKKYQVVAVKNGGTISGKVTLDTAKAESQGYTISKDSKVCGAGTRTLQWVRANGKALQDVVVYLENVPTGKAFPAAANKITINQKGCRFQPSLSVLANGGKLEAINLDPVLHNIHTYELIKKARRTVFNVSQPNQGDKFSKKVKLRRGIAMKVECDAHDFMHGYVFVANNPYFATVDKNGSFSIGNVPPGTYTIKSWHGWLGVKNAKVKVAAGGKATVSLSY